VKNINYHTRHLPPPPKLQAAAGRLPSLKLSVLTAIKHQSTHPLGRKPHSPPRHTASIHGSLQLGSEGLQAGGRGQPRPEQRRALYQPQRHRSPADCCRIRLLTWSLFLPQLMGFSLAAPRVAGFLVKIFAWVLEMPAIGWMVLCFLKRDNLVTKVLCLASVPCFLLSAKLLQERDDLVH
jgi:hypothetical protein